MKIAIIFVCYITVVVGAEMAFAKESSPPLFANSKEDLVEWGKEGRPLFRLIHLNVDKKEVLVATWEIGSGVYWTAVAVYVKSSNMQKWRLLLISDAHTSQIAVNYDEENKELQFISKAQKRLFSIPGENLD